MFTDYVDAGRSLAAFKRKFSSQLSGLDVQYRVSYNKNEGSRTEGNFGLGEIRRLLGVASQAGEVVFQTAGDRLSGFYRFVAGIDPLPDFVQSYYSEISNAVDYGAAIVDGDVTTH